MSAAQWITNRVNFAPLQRGFREGFSCDTPLVKCTHDIFMLTAYCCIVTWHLTLCYTVVLAYQMHFWYTSKPTFVKKSSAVFLMVCAHQMFEYSQEYRKGLFSGPCFSQFSKDIFDHTSSHVQLHAAFAMTLPVKLTTFRCKTTLTVVSWCNSKEQEDSHYV